MVSRENITTPPPPFIQMVLEPLFKRLPHLAPVREQLIRTCEIIGDAFERGEILYLCGNGGSFADALHIKGELAKSFEKSRPIRNPDIISRLRGNSEGKILLDNLEVGLPVIVLGESHSLRSAFANDRDAELIYAQELNSFAPFVKGGVILGISTSGGARNVLAALQLAQAYGMAALSFTGPDGGKVAQIADVALKVPGESTAQIQENQQPVYHALCRMLERRFFA